MRDEGTHAAWLQQLSVDMHERATAESRALCNNLRAKPCLTPNSQSLSVPDAAGWRKTGASAGRSSGAKRCTTAPLGARPPRRRQEVHNAAAQLPRGRKLRKTFI